MTYHTTTSDNKQEWTPVVRKRRKHPVVHRPGPRAGSLQDRGSLEPSTDDSSDDSPMSLLSIPSHAKVGYVEIDGTPGLRIGTRCTRSWTPIAARIQLKSKNKSHPIIQFVKSQIFRLYASLCNLAIHVYLNVGLLQHQKEYNYTLSRKKKDLRTD